MSDDGMDMDMDMDMDDSDEDSIQEEEEEEEVEDGGNDDKKFLFPFYFIILAHSLCFLYQLFCAHMCILYAVYFGSEAELMWHLGSAIGLFQDFFIVEPITILLACINELYFAEFTGRIIDFFSAYIPCC
jgi:hypothetical protein